MPTNPLPQLIPACERIARLCGVEMPAQVFTWTVDNRGNYYHVPIPDDLYALMLVGWFGRIRRWFNDYRGQCITVNPALLEPLPTSASRQYWTWKMWTPGSREPAISGTADTEAEAITAALTAACDILDARGEVG